MNLKIGILTLYYNNYNMGGALQAYALQRALTNLGYDAEQVCFNFAWHIGGSSRMKYAVRKMADFLGIRKNTSMFTYEKRIQRFNEFLEGIPHSKNISYKISDFSDLYDCILVGSDQVWSSWLPEGALDVFLLKDEGLNGKKFSYAASLGTDTLSDQMGEKLSNALRDFENISLREGSAVKLLDKYLDTGNIQVNIDSTLLLERKQWDDLVIEPHIAKKYIFCYFLGKDRLYRKYAETFARNLGLEIAYIPYAKEHFIEGFDNNVGKLPNISGGPREFLGLIKNAEFVLTDSYHAVVFSCLYGKGFYVMARDIEEQITMNNRITDFLNNYNLRERYLAPMNLSVYNFGGKIDFNKINAKFDMQRKDSLKYLSSLFD